MSESLQIPFDFEQNGPNGGTCSASEAPGVIVAGPDEAGLATQTTPAKDLRGGGQAEGNGDGRVRLVVSLINSLPDAAGDGFARLLSGLKAKCDALNPWLDVCFKSINVGEDLYSDADTDRGLINKLLTSPVRDDGAGGAHVAEVDTVLLEHLARRGAIRPWTPACNYRDCHPAGSEACEVGGKVYAVPHWLCTYVLFSRRPDVARTRDIRQLASLPAEIAPFRLAGKIGGRWNGPMLYCSAYVALYGRDRLREALNTNLDEFALESVRALTRLCGGRGHRSHATSNQETDAPKLFATGQTEGLVGYTENLHDLLRLGDIGEELQLAPLAFRHGHSPLLYVDAFVLRRNCSARCERAARAFVEFMNRPETLGWIMMSKDAGPGGIPRYVIPANRQAYLDPDVKGDPYYRQFERIAKDALPCPTDGFYEFGKRKHAKIEAELQAVDDRVIVDPNERPHRKSPRREAFSQQWREVRSKGKA